MIEYKSTVKKPRQNLPGNVSCANVLYLTLKKKWFDMILSGEKKEEYREIKQYWLVRLFRHDWRSGELDQNMIDEVVGELNKNIYTLAELDRWASWKLKRFDFICFKNGYHKDAPEMWFGCNGIRIGEAKPEWSDNAKGNFFIIDLGKIFAFPVELR